VTSLELTLLYLLAAVLGVVACRSLKLPPMLGYLVVGVVIGPNALALAQSSEGIKHLGEFGVVFLMFVIGLEFNLPKLRAMRRHVFGLGLSQVGARRDSVGDIRCELAELCEGDGDVQVLPLPVAMPTMVIAQYWHERAHRDGGSMWLRGLMRRLFRKD